MTDVRQMDSWWDGLQTAAQTTLMNGYGFTEWDALDTEMKEEIYASHQYEEEDDEILEDEEDEEED